MADPLLAALDRARAGPGDPRAGSHGRARGTHAGRAVPAHAHIALTACGRHTRDARDEVSCCLKLRLPSVACTEWGGLYRLYSCT